MGFATFIASTAGRLVRIIAGLVLIAVGVWVIGGLWGIILAVVGVVPLFAGLWDVCIIGALFLGTPLRGDEIRTSAEE